MEKIKTILSKKNLIIIFLLGILIYGYSFNLSSNNTAFDDFQEGSQDLVIDAIENEKNNMMQSGYNLFTVSHQSLSLSHDTSVENNQALFIDNDYAQNNFDEAFFVVSENDEKIKIDDVQKLEIEDKNYFLVTFATDVNELLSKSSHSLKLAGENEKIFEPIKTVSEYVSQYGLQGQVFTLIAKITNYKMPVFGYELICSFLMALTALLISYYIFKKYSKLLGACFYVVFLCSPWIINFARNLYWVEFTWFLPMLIGLIFSVSDKRKYLCYFLTFASILVKCLCGYEYISTIMLGLVLFPVVELFLKSDKNFIKKQILHIFLIGVFAVFAFGVAILIHANLRGNGNIVLGLENIYEQDILRRTLGGSVSNFDSMYSSSLEASVFSTIKRYLFIEQPTYIILGVEGLVFLPACLLVAVILTSKKINKEKTDKFVMPILVISLCATLSWFVLGKAHSFIHVHMNYVLWYFGFIQIMLFIIVKFIIDDIIPLIKKKSLNKKLKK